MNLFEKYGIKEVADVVFYSINEVGDDEVIYTPVLYLDTLKVSTLEKSAESTFATGGLKNKNLIKWNYGKNIKLSLEDALFSPASMSMIWGGKLDSKLSSVTSLISKINFANTYGRLRYSTKAYPSPQLTNDEWEIVFKIISYQLGITGHFTKYNVESDILDIDVKSKLSDEYKTAFRNRYFNRPVMFNGIEEISEDDGSNDEDKTWTYLYDKSVFNTNFGASYLKISQQNIEGYENIDQHYDDNNDLKTGHYRWYEAKAMPEFIIFKLRQLITELNQIGKIETNINDLEIVDRMEKCLVTKRGGLEIDTKKQLDNLFRYYANDNSGSYTIYYDAKTMLPLLHIENDTIVTKDGANSSAQNREVRTSGGTMYASIIDIRKTTVFSKSDVDNNKVENMSLFSDVILEDLLSFLVDNGMVAEDADTSTISDYSIIVTNTNQWTETGVAITYNIDTITYGNSKTYTASHKFKIKFGTTYYKWTRTVKYKEYEDDGVLGQSFIIDADTFPADYRVVGETYIRNQKTGKDQRYQFTIFRANVSFDTSITLQADGDPTTFTMDIDVLAPENDIMMELRQMDVEEDRFEGGTRIVPQRGKYTYTPAMEDYGEVLTPIENNEIY